MPGWAPPVPAEVTDLISPDRTGAGAPTPDPVDGDPTEGAPCAQAVARSPRLASLGMLAAGIAHDLNNLLTVVSMRADMIRTDALEGVPGDPAGDAAAILEAADRAAALTRQLTLFAGRHEGENRPVDLAAPVDGLRPVVAGQLGPHAGVGGVAGARPGRVLVVDDAPATRAVHGRVLERAGYEVVLAENGLQALAVLAAEPGIVAVLSDVLMPGMDGTALAGRVLREHPTVRVLLVTGIAPPTDVLVHPRVTLVGKPITSSHLVAELRGLLAVALD